MQDKLRENGARLWAWLCDGAYIYICGDASRMAKDVHNTLPNIIGQHRGMTRDEASVFLDEVTARKRYLRDIY